MSKASTGTMVLPTPSAVALWQHELSGQISDGTWEGARPRDHWKFWSGLQAVLRPDRAPAVDTIAAHECKRVGYRFSDLYPVVGGRMVQLGRMGLAAHGLGRGTLTYEQRLAAESMPETLEQWFNLHEASLGASVRDDALAIDAALARAYYATSYGDRDMRRDVSRIKLAMTTVRPKGA